MSSRKARSGNRNLRTAVRNTVGPMFQALERRILLTDAPPPIDPSTGEAILMGIVDSAPVEEINNALDRFPVPYVIQTQWFGPASSSISVSGDPQALSTPITVTLNNKAGVPTKVDVDQSKATGKGGNDIEVVLNTVLLPTPHLALEVTRLGNAPFVENFQVLVSFPFSAFYGGPPTPGAPNLFMGYRTLAAEGEPGGIAPLFERMRFIPGNLAGTNHLYDVELNTTGSSNPLLFIMGNFDGTAATGAINAGGFGLQLETATHRVPSQVQVGLTTTASVVGLVPTGSFGIDWTASERAIATFSYIETEDLAVSTADFATTFRVDQMPVQEEFQFQFTAGGGVTVIHEGLTPIDSATFRHQRRDGSLIKLQAAEIPTEVRLGMGISPQGDTSVGLSVLDNTMELTIEAIQVGGFPGVAGPLGPNGVGYLRFEVENAVDLDAGLIASQPLVDGLVDLNRDGLITVDDTGRIGGIPIINGVVDFDRDGTAGDADDTTLLFGFNLLEGRFDTNLDGQINSDDVGPISGVISALARHPGEAIQRMDLIADDDAHYVPDPLDAEQEILVGLQLPPAWDAVPQRHIVSFIENGLHGTFAARLLSFREALFDLNSTNLAQGFKLLTESANPLQAYLRFGESSAFLSDNDPDTEPDNDDIEVTLDVFDLPAGELKLNYTPQFNVSYETIPAQDIALIHAYGHIGLANFDVALGELPPFMEFNFDPAGSFSLVAEDGGGGPDVLGSFALRLWESQVAVSDGLFDLNLDGEITAVDTGTFMGYGVAEGLIDINMDGVFDADDDGLLLKHKVIEGKLDVDDSEEIDTEDDLTAADASPGLEGTEILLGERLRDVRIRLDQVPSLSGTWGDVTQITFEGGSVLSTVAAGDVVYVQDKGTALVRTGSQPGVVEGTIELIRHIGEAFASGDTLRVLDRLAFDGQVAAFAVGDWIIGANSNARARVMRVDQLAGRGVVFLTDRTGNFQDNEPLLVDLDGDGPETGGMLRAVANGTQQTSAWTATIAAEPVAAGMNIGLGTTEAGVFFGGFQLAASTAVELSTPLPPPIAPTSNFLDLTDIDYSLSDEPVPGRLIFGFFGIDDLSLSTVGGFEAHFAADAARPLTVQINSGFGGLADPAKAMDLTLQIQAVPQQLDLKTNMTTRLDYTASSAIDSISVLGVIDSQDDDVLNFRIINGSIDLDGDGAITEADSGLYKGHAVVEGTLDVNGDGVIDQADDGPLLGASFVNGRIDLDDDGVAGTSDDREPNGMELLFSLANLPQEIHLRAAPAAAAVISGFLDLDGNGEITEADDGEFAGLQVFDGMLDLNEDGIADENDDGSFLGRTIRDGRVNLNGSLAVNDQDTGTWQGVQINMSDQIDAVELLQRMQSDELGIDGGDNRIFHFAAETLPANLLLASFGLSFDFAQTSDNGSIFETTDTAGERASIGSLSLLNAISQEAATIAELRRAFQQTAGGPVGAVLDGSTPSRINYSPYLQSIDFEYHDAGDQQQVLDRLAQLYADGAVLDTDNDHVAIRNAGGKAIFTDILLRGFQQAEASYSIVPNPLSPDLFNIIDDAELEFRAPFPGAHPLYFGLANSDGAVNGEDDGFFAGRAVINGRLDMDGDGAIDSADGGFAFGKKVIAGELDLDGDNEVTENDAGFLRGIRVIEGRLDVSETLLYVDIENVPDRLEALIDVSGEELGYDANSSPGDIDVYNGTVTITPDNSAALRVRANDTPRYVNVTWGAELLNGGISVDAQDTFEALLLIQAPLDTGAPARFIGGLRMEDIQLGYDIELLTFDVAEELEIPIGTPIIDGRLDMDGNGVTNNQDDGELDGKQIINGRVDMNGDGQVDGDDDGTIMLIQWAGLIPFPEFRDVIDGLVDQNGDDEITGADDYDNPAIPVAWDLFRATVGIDNNAESTDIEADFDKSAINGFFSMYTMRDNPLALDSGVHGDGPPAPRGAEFVPLISTVLDEFRELSYTLALTLDPLTPNVHFAAAPVNLLSVEHGLILSPGATVNFDFWVQDVFNFGPLTIDLPDDIVIELFDVVIFEFDMPDDFDVAARFGGDYASNSPLHLFPVTIDEDLDHLLGTLVFEDINGAFTLTEILLHQYGDHEDPFD